MDFYQILWELKGMADLAALAVARQMSPAFDEVKMEEAIQLAGSKRWVMYHIRQGNLNRIRRGTAKNSPIYYSRMEIAAIKMAEREMTKLR